MADKCLNGCGTTVHKPRNSHQRSYYPICRNCARKAVIRRDRIDARNRRQRQEQKDDSAD